jgi:hypothetical protein
MKYDKNMPNKFTDKNNKEDDKYKNMQIID